MLVNPRESFPRLQALAFHILQHSRPSIIKSTISNSQVSAPLTLSVTKDAEAIRAVLKAYEHALNTDSADAAGVSHPYVCAGIS